MDPGSEAGMTIVVMLTTCERERKMAHLKRAMTV
jgi:hypothetical protein